MKRIRPRLNTVCPRKKKISFSELIATKNILRKFNLHSVCEEAKCPNISECFGEKTATFLILGDTCTRNCSFCGIKKGVPSEPDKNEPLNIVEAVKELDIRFVIITSVTRDDLPDGGACVFAETVKLVRKTDIFRKTEILIPDFQGSADSIKAVVEAKPDILSHNLETVRSLYPYVRSKADYRRSLELLKTVKKENSCQLTKSGIMLGLGEKRNEVLQTIGDIADTGCDFLSIGQYLAPAKSNHSVSSYASEGDFAFYAEKGREMGFKHIESGYYVRSSYNAHKYHSKAPERRP